jgi:hypothetical protein
MIALYLLLIVIAAYVAYCETHSVLVGVSFLGVGIAALFTI